MTISHIKAKGKVRQSELKQVAELCKIGKKFPLAGTKHPGIKGGASELWALRDISFNFRGGEIFGVIGRNGAGKTTLLNLLAQTLSASEGTINTVGRVAGLLNLGVGFQDELSGRDNIFLNGTILGASRSELEKRMDSIIEFSELGEFIYQPLGAYSQGMRLRLGFSIIVNLSFDILLIDEVLAVGDTLFQDKCFRRLTEFRRLGKTLVITSQNMDLIARLCDQVILLDHGRLLFIGSPSEGVNRYRKLLNTEKFFVGPADKKEDLVRQTKRWAEDLSGWGSRLGTREAVIRSVKFINRFGRSCSKVKSGSSLKIRVDFDVSEEIKYPHFGVAVFRQDGVYCYGPNTKFDGHAFPRVGPGKYSFVLNYNNLFLASGIYKVSVAIWDENETLAFDYHEGCYDLEVTGGRKNSRELISIPFRSSSSKFLERKKECNVLDSIKECSKSEVKISLALLNSRGEEKSSFFTAEPVKFIFDLKKVPGHFRAGYYLWCGIYRDDGVYCQGIAAPIKKSNSLSITFPSFLLLPGGYKISYGIWDESEGRFDSFWPDARLFEMAFKQRDHGTIYLKHNWKFGRRA